MPLLEAEPATQLPEMHRRRFYMAAIYGIWAVISLALAIPAAIYLLFPPRSRKGEEWVEAGALADLETDVPKELVFLRRRVDGWKVSNEKTSAWVVKKSGGEVVAFAPQCTHLGCAYRWEDRKRTFLCPCHTSNFDINGKVIDGPAPRPLDRYHVRVDGGKLLLGAITRSTEA